MVVGLPTAPLGPRIRRQCGEMKMNEVDSDSLRFEGFPFLKIIFFSCRQ